MLITGTEVYLDRLYAYMTSSPKGSWGMGFDHWDWVPGVGLIAMMDYGVTMKRKDVISYVKDWVERNKQLAGTMKVINSTAPFAVFPELYRQTGNEWFVEQSRQIAQWMLEEAPRTREGAFEHTVTEKVGFPEQVWADTLFMAVLFLARHAGLTGDRKAAEEALRQTTLHLRLLQDRETGLLFHGWDCQSGHHMSAVRWARANAWIAVAVPEIVMEIRGLTAIPEQLTERYVRLAGGLRGCQSGDGLWHTVLDRPDFYKEASGSAGIACGFMKAVRAGMLDSSYLAAAWQTVQGLLPLISAEGEVTSVSGGTPVMPSAEAYNGIPLFPTLYGQGLTMMLLTEAAKPDKEGGDGAWKL